MGNAKSALEVMPWNVFSLIIVSQLDAYKDLRQLQIRPKDNVSPVAKDVGSVI